MKKLFRYGMNRPALTWSVLVLGIVLLAFDTYFTFFNSEFVALDWAALVFNGYVIGLIVLLLLVVILVLLGLTRYKYRLVDNLIRHYDLRTTSKILDVSTGTGYFVTHVVKAAGYIAFATGIEDTTQKQISRARKNARRMGVNNRINMIHGDIRHLPFPAAAFNLVTMLDHHRSLFSRPQSKFYQSVCNEISRVLKSNGVFLLVSNRKTVARVERYFNASDQVSARLIRNLKPRFGWRILEVRETV